MTTPNIAAALAAFQAEMPTVAKGNRAEVPTKSGGKYTYTYADLADVTEAAMPLLTRNGLAFTACPRQTERGYELAGRLMHTSGESIEGALPIAGNSPQEMGSSLTYMRRYLLGCMTGLVTDDDDDGHLAQKASTARPKREATPATDKPMTPAQNAKLFALLGERGITDREARLVGISRVLGREVTSSKELTTTDAKAVIDSLEASAKEGAA